MKYLKKYKIFESQIPENLIELKSIGHVLDPDSGVVYPMFKRGGYDKENPWDVEDEISNMSDEDMEIVSKYMTYSKDVIDVDDKTINDIKDILLDLIDNSYKVSVSLEVNTIHVLTNLFGNERDWSHYVNLFPKYLKMVKDSDKYIYSINIRGNYSSKFESNITDDDIIDSILRLKSYLDKSKYTITDIQTPDKTIPIVDFEKYPIINIMLKDIKTDFTLIFK
jgi:hypothetical protein